MANIIQSLWAKNNLTAHRPQSAGAVHEQRFTYDFASVGVLAAEFLELGVLPANARVVDAQVFAEGSWGAITANIGLLSGEFGVKDNARTLGSELFAAQNVNNTVTAIARLSKPDAQLLDRTEKHRGIGVQFSADVAAGAKKLHLRLFYAQ